jgi:hypothetical protein
MELSTPHPRRVPTTIEIQHCVTTVGNLNAEIGDLQDQSEKVQRRLRTLERQRLNHLSFMSPLRCLPPEIIIEVCKACIDAGITPFLLSRICGRFCDVILNAKVLWSHIHVLRRAPLSTSRAYPYVSMQSIHL